MSEPHVSNRIFVLLLLLGPSSLRRLDCLVRRRSAPLEVSRLLLLLSVAFSGLAGTGEGLANGIGPCDAGNFFVDKSCR